MHRAIEVPLCSSSLVTFITQLQMENRESFSAPPFSSHLQTGIRSELIVAEVLQGLVNKTTE